MTIKKWNLKCISIAEHEDNKGIFTPNLICPTRSIEFQQPEVKGYGPKPSKSVSEDTSNEVKESLDASLVKELVSDDNSDFKNLNGGYVTFGEEPKEAKFWFARIEAIRLFLAYASFKDFVVYQMDLKSSFLYGKIEEEVYVCQPLGFEDPKFLDRVYKWEELHIHLEDCRDSERCWDISIVQDKYVDEILKKFGFSTVKIASTPMETSKLLLKDT
ncbi:ribonuclease H-like domain, reverse transcriptase, RNA-dependent DNA polymerase [Tanacetum coccineum]